MKRSYMKRKKSKHDWPKMCFELQERSGGFCEGERIDLETGKVTRCGRYIGIITPNNCHHVIARSKGGSDNIDNLLALCSSLEFFGKEDNSCHTAEHFK